MVAKVVGRQDLSLGVGTSIASGTNRGASAGGSAGGGGGGGFGDEGMSLLPVSEEERNVRLAELMSFGVDLPNETLITLLRCCLGGLCCVVLWLCCVASLFRFSCLR